MAAPCPPTPGGLPEATSEPSTPSLRVIGFASRRAAAVAAAAEDGDSSSPLSSTSGAATPVAAGPPPRRVRRSPPESPLGRLLREQSVPSLPALGLSISTKGCKPTLAGLRTPASARGSGHCAGGPPLAGGGPALRLRSFSHSDLASPDLLLSRSSDPIVIPLARCVGAGRFGGRAGPPGRADLDFFFLPGASNAKCEIAREAENLPRFWGAPPGPAPGRGRVRRPRNGRLAARA